MSDKKIRQVLGRVGNRIREYHFDQVEVEWKVDRELVSFLIDEGLVKNVLDVFAKRNGINLFSFIKVFLFKVNVEMISQGPSNTDINTSKILSIAIVGGIGKSILTELHDILY